jgi:phasin
MSAEPLPPPFFSVFSYPGRTLLRRTIYVALQHKIGHYDPVLSPQVAEGRRAAARGDVRNAAKDESMVDPIYQVPNEVRDFAEKSVEQARKAFEGFVGAAQKALTSAGDLPMVPPSAKDMSAKAMSFAEANVNAAFDLAQKLVHAKDPQEVFQLQAEFVKSQLAAIQEQTKELGAALQKSATTRS